MALSIYYDGECPFCQRYISLLRLKETAGPVTLYDLREHSEEKDRLIEKGYDLDLGMVIDMDGRLIGGSDAVNHLAMLSTPSTLFNKINKWIMSTGFLATLLYPFLRAGRWLTLFVMGRKQIMPSEEGAQARASIFGLLFSLFTVFHFFTYTLRYGHLPPEWDLVVLLLAALLLFFKPQSPRLLLLLMLASTISAIMQAPVGSNHTIVRNFAVLGYWPAFIYTAMRGRSWTHIFTNFSVAGQGTLFVMYFFGVFHKINADFLNPETSCAVELWHKMPPPLNFIRFDAMYYLAIYGTFIVEAVLVLMLITKRYRHIGIICGITFHLLLGLSGYAMYISFTTLSIALHCLFINEEAALKIQNSSMMKLIADRKHHPVYIGAALILVGLVVLMGLTRQYSMVTIFMLPVLLPLCFVIMRHGYSLKPLTPRENRPGAYIIGGTITALFFANCAMPYLGLKSAQSVNMFANLRLEAGVSNHVIMKNAPGPYKYLEDVVKITDVKQAPRISTYEKSKHAKVYYDLLAFIDDNPEAVVSYTRGGKTYNNMTAISLSDDIDNILHPKWFRKWFHFQPVDLNEPHKCGH